MSTPKTIGNRLRGATNGSASFPIGRGRVPGRVFDLSSHALVTGRLRLNGVWEGGSAREPNLTGSRSEIDCDGHFSRIAVNRDLQMRFSNFEPWPGLEAKIRADFADLRPLLPNFSICSIAIQKLGCATEYGGCFEIKVTIGEFKRPLLFKYRAPSGYPALIAVHEAFQSFRRRRDVSQ